MLGARSPHNLGETRAGEKSHSVPPFMKVAGDGQEWRDVPVDRHGSNDDGRH